MSINVGVFFGGRSVESEVSIISAMQAMANLNSEKYNAVPVYITKSGKLLYGKALTDIDNYNNLIQLEKLCDEIYITPIKSSDRGLSRGEIRKVGVKSKKPICVIDAALPVVHGTYTEDGTLQGFFELLGLPYACSGVAASAVGMDKVLFKTVCAAARLPVLPGVCVSGTEWFSNRADALSKIAELEFPVVVKPVNLGSSVGISRASDETGLIAASELALSFSDRILIEPCVEQLREINCAVLWNGAEYITSACEEPFRQDEILSFSDKYKNKLSGLNRKLPADISAEKSAEISELAAAAFKAIDGFGVARIDFLMDTSDGDKVYINEINTIPGSLSFYLWRESGMSFSELLDQLIKGAFYRARAAGRLDHSYTSNILSGVNLGSKGKI